MANNKEICCHFPAAQGRIDYFLSQKYRFAQMDKRIKEIIKDDQTRIIERRELRIFSKNNYYNSDDVENRLSIDANRVGLGVRSSFSVDCAKKIGGVFNYKYILRRLYCVELNYEEGYPGFGLNVQFKINSTSINSAEDISANLIRDETALREGLAEFASASEGDLIYKSSYFNQRDRIRNDF